MCMGLGKVCDLTINSLNLRLRLQLQVVACTGGLSPRDLACRDTGNLRSVILMKKLPKNLTRRPEA